jgi:transcriptional regulator with XRE-family HTH domain
MSFGERLMLARKRKGLSQAEIGKQVGIQGDAYGRYERNIVKPNIEIATKISNILDISLDYLVGKRDHELDEEVLSKVEDISKMDPVSKSHVFALLDAFLIVDKFKK